ncbi:MAG: hypothetical protein AB7O96_17810 [Pseudobdellovibrionaceae bacterium]
MKILIFISALFFVVASRAEWNVELQWNVCMDSESRLIEIFESDKLEMTKRNISYYDTKDLQLLAQNVVVRERVENKKSEINVKVKVSEDAEISDEWKETKGFKCEFDVHGQNKIFHCSLKVKHKIEEATNEFLSRKQVQFLKEFAPETVDLLKDVKKMGAIKNKTYDLETEDVEVTIEADRYKGSYFLEISQRVPYSESLAAKEQMQAFLSEKGIKLCERQESSTTKKLKALSSN